MYDMGSAPPMRDTLEPYIADGSVQYQHVQGNLSSPAFFPRFQQLIVYELCIKNATAAGHRWMGAWGGGALEAASQAAAAALVPCKQLSAVRWLVLRAAFSWLLLPPPRAPTGPCCLPCSVPGCGRVHRAAGRRRPGRPRPAAAVRGLRRPRAQLDHVWVVGARGPAGGRGAGQLRELHARRAPGAPPREEHRGPAAGGEAVDPPQL